MEFLQGQGLGVALHVGIEREQRLLQADVQRVRLHGGGRYLPCCALHQRGERLPLHQLPRDSLLIDQLLTGFPVALGLIQLQNGVLQRGDDPVEALGFQQEGHGVPLHGPVDGIKLAVPGEEDHAAFGPVRADAAHQLQAVHAGHVDVGDDNVHAGFRQKGQGLLAAVGTVQVDIQPAFGQYGHQALHNNRLVVNNQDSSHGQPPVGQGESAWLPAGLPAGCG